MSMKRSFEGFSGVQGGFRTFATASQVIWCENDRFCTIVSARSAVDLRVEQVICIKFGGGEGGGGEEHLCYHLQTPINRGNHVPSIVKYLGT